MGGCHYVAEVGHAAEDERDVHGDADGDPGCESDADVDAGGAVRSAPTCVWKSTSELSAVTPSSHRRGRARSLICTQAPAAHSLDDPWNGVETQAATFGKWKLRGYQL